MNTLGELCTLMVIWVVESFKRGVSILDSLYLAGYKESRILSLHAVLTVLAVTIGLFYPDKKTTFQDHFFVVRYVLITFETHLFAF